MQPGASPGKNLITLGVHFAIFMIFLIMSRGRFPSAGLTFWWGLGLAAHAAYTIRDVALAQRARPRLESNPSETVYGPPPAALRSAAARGFSAEANALLDAIERQRRERALHPTLDLHGLREAVAELHRRTEALAAVGDEAELHRLDLALDSARERARLAPDEASVEAHELEIEALQDRMAGMQAAISTRERLQARQRTLLHQLQSLRTAAAHALATEAPADFDDLKAQAERLHEEVRASREVEEALARGRRLAAGRASRQPAG